MTRNTLLCSTADFCSGVLGWYVIWLSTLSPVCSTDSVCSTSVHSCPSSFQARPLEIELYSNFLITFGFQSPEKDTVGNMLFMSTSKSIILPLTLKCELVSLNQKSWETCNNLYRSCMPTTKPGIITTTEGFSQERPWKESWLYVRRQLCHKTNTTGDIGSDSAYQKTDNNYQSRNWKCFSKAKYGTSPSFET